MNAARKTITLMGMLACIACAVAAEQTRAQSIQVEPLKQDGIYETGDRVGWTITRRPGDTRDRLTYQLRADNAVLLRAGDLDLSSGPARVDVTVDKPCMVYLELAEPARADAPSPAQRPIASAGAAVAPHQIQPVQPRPADFDSFWASKVDWLKTIPANPTLTPADSGRSDVDYALIQMDHVNGTHVYGQLAKPKREGKFPALVIFQWASPPYPLERSWVTDRAAQGFLTLNIEPHDVLPREPKAYYDALPDARKRYESIGNDDREKSYFLEMYLRDYRAVEYLASRDDWDGRTLIVMGTSMGGQQSIAVAGLHPKVTHLVVHEPAGCDTNAVLHDRHASYPNFPVQNPKVAATAPYFDPVNFASRVRARALVSMGFVDTTATPTGIWTMFNQLQGPKEAAPMIDAPHNNLATPTMQLAFTLRAEQWLAALGRGDAIPQPSPTSQPATRRAAFDDHADMMRQLGIRSLRPGPNGNDASIYEEARANSILNTLPDVLRMNDGTKVSQADEWPARRAEIAELFEREIYGRIPADVPAVTWTVSQTTRGESNGIATVTKTLVGHVDNRAYPQINVDIQASFTVPANAARPVPMMIEFTFPPFPGRRPTSAAAATTSQLQRPSWHDQAIAHGWGWATLSPASIQPDNNQLTTAGIIGLTNRGKPRTPEQWGTLRAWQWGASRLIDYFEQNADSKVDVRKIGIEGLSRYGKAAAVTQAFEPRIAVGLIGSSGEGGTKLYRHLFGEAVENLAGGGEYHWMAGNFIKYAGSDPQLTTADLPVDAHELIALCAPRPCFISHGVPEKGDANWIDARGSFMAAILAGPVYELLGAKGLGTPGDYRSDPMPPVGTRIGGELAWRQHEGGHDVTPNWPSFFEWVSKYVESTPPNR